jgi:hypothetical protein
MAGFLLTNRLDATLRAEHRTDFARRYNGPDYARNQYDTRLAAEYRKLGLPDLTTRALMIDGGSSRRTTVMRLCPGQPADISLIRGRRRPIECEPAPSGLPSGLEDRTREIPT